MQVKANKLTIYKPTLKIKSFETAIKQFRQTRNTISAVTRSARESSKSEGGEGGACKNILINKRNIALCDKLYDENKGNNAQLRLIKEISNYQISRRINK